MNDPLVGVGEDCNEFPKPLGAGRVGTLEELELEELWGHSI